MIIPLTHARNPPSPFIKRKRDTHQRSKTTPASPRLRNKATKTGSTTIAELRDGNGAVLGSESEPVYPDSERENVVINGPKTAPYVVNLESNDTMTSLMADHKYAREFARLRDQVKQLEEQVRVRIIDAKLATF